MALHTLGEAQKLTGKSKPTISRACKKGTLTYTKNDKGEYQIETSELQRVYGALRSPSNDTGTMKRSETPNNTSVLQAKLDMANERLAEKDAIIEDLRQEKDDWKEEAKGIRLLVDHTPKKDGRNLWQRIWNKD